MSHIVLAQDPAKLELFKLTDDVFESTLTDNVEAGLYTEDDANRLREERQQWLEEQPVQEPTPETEQPTTEQQSRFREWQESQKQQRAQERPLLEQQIDAIIGDQAVETRREMGRSRADELVSTSVDALDLGKVWDTYYGPLRFEVQRTVTALNGLLVQAQDLGMSIPTTYTVAPQAELESFETEIADLATGDYVLPTAVKINEAITSNIWPRSTYKFPEPYGVYAAPGSMGSHNAKQDITFTSEKGRGELERPDLVLERFKDHLVKNWNELVKYPMGVESYYNEYVKRINESRLDSKDKLDFIRRLKEVYDEVAYYGGKAAGEEVATSEEEAGRYVARDLLKERKPIKSILKAYSEEVAGGSIERRDGFWGALVDYSTIANGIIDDPSTVYSDISALESRKIPQNILDIFNQNGIQVGEGTAVDVGKRPDEWIITIPRGDKKYEYIVRDESYRGKEVLSINSAGRDLTGYIRDYYDKHQELTWRPRGDYFTKAPEEFTTTDFATLGNDVIDYYTKMGKAVDLTPAAINNQIATYIIKNGKHMSIEDYATLVGTLPDEIKDRIPYRGSSKTEKIFEWFHRRQGRETGEEVRRTWEKEETKAVTPGGPEERVSPEQPSREEEPKEPEEEVEEPGPKEETVEEKEKEPKKQPTKAKEIEEPTEKEKPSLESLVADLISKSSANITSDRGRTLLSQVDALRDAGQQNLSIMGQIGFSPIAIGRINDEGYKFSEILDEIVRQAPQWWGQKTSSLLPKTETEFIKMAQEYYPSYLPGMGSDPLSNQLFNRGPEPEAPPEFPYHVGEQATLKDLNFPQVTGYLDYIADTDFNISDFSDKVSGKGGKAIEFIYDETKPHAKWKDDEHLQINLYRVKDVEDLMGVLVHEFRHVLTVMSGEPMSDKEDREEAAPDEYVEFPEENKAFPEMINFMSHILEMPRAKIKSELLDIVGKENEEKVDEWLDEAFSKVKTANYPSHPDNVVIKSNEYYPNGLTESQVWRYYDSVKGKIVNDLKGHDVMLVLNANGEVHKRHGEDPNAFIKISNTTDFDKYNNGRTVEFHKVIGGESKYGFIDVDPKEKVPFDKVKKVVGEVYNIIDSLPDVEKVVLAYSGGRGFHLYPYFREERPVNNLHRELLQFLDLYVSESRDDKLTTGIAKGKDMIRLDTSTLKKSGSLRAVGSLNGRTGLRCVPISVGKLTGFGKEDAVIPSSILRESVLQLPESEGEFLELLQPTT